jgi:hypothetical protein
MGGRIWLVFLIRTKGTCYSTALYFSRVVSCIVLPDLLSDECMMSALENGEALTHTLVDIEKAVCVTLISLC